MIKLIAAVLAALLAVSTAVEIGLAIYWRHRAGKWFAHRLAGVLICGCFAAACYMIATA